MHPTPEVTLLLTFDVDAWSGWAALGASSPSLISRGEFAAIGVERLLGLLDRRGIRVTFFVPGHTTRVFPRVVETIAAAGHEIGHHGDSHRSPAEMKRVEEAGELDRGIERIEGLVGRAPRGYRSPSWELSDASVALLVERGFVYDSSMMAGDCSPYWSRSGDSWSVSGEFEIGDPMPLVELPVAWHRDDVPLFEYMFAGQLRTQGGAAPSAVEEIWLGDFEDLYDALRQGMLVYTMHPEVIGHGHRLLLLERFLDAVQARPGVRFSTCGDYAEAWRSTREPTLPPYLAPSTHE